MSEVPEYVAENRIKPHHPHAGLKVLVMVQHSLFASD